MPCRSERDAARARRDGVVTGGGPEIRAALAESRRLFAELGVDLGTMDGRAEFTELQSRAAFGATRW